jgi:DNA-directed RNA polymerase specialized sigma24 family protein
MTNGHPWKDLEEQLQKIRELAQDSEGSRSREIRKLIDEVNPFVTHAASRIVGSPRLRHFHIDAGDAVQQFWTVMLKAGFRNYKPVRGPLYAYAYVALSRLCANTTRGPRRKLPCPLIGDCADRSKPLKRLGIKEKWGMVLYRAVRKLPRKYRRAILLKYWFDKEAKAGAARCAISVAKYNTWVCQGHKKLQNRFDGQSWSHVA